MLGRCTQIREAGGSERCRRAWYTGVYSFSATGTRRGPRVKCRGTTMDPEEGAVRQDRERLATLTTGAARYCLCDSHCAVGRCQGSSAGGLRAVCVHLQPSRTSPMYPKRPRIPGAQTVLGCAPRIIVFGGVNARADDMICLCARSACVPRHQCPTRHRHFMLDVHFAILMRLPNHFHALIPIPLPYCNDPACVKDGAQDDDPRVAEPSLQVQRLHQG